MEFSEVYTALQQGTLDGMENPPDVLYKMKMHEVAKYYTWTFRVDHTISDKQRIFVRGSAYTRNSTYNNYLANTLLSGNFFSFFSPLPVRKTRRRERRES